MRRKSSTFWLVMLSSVLVMTFTGQAQAKSSKVDVISIVDGTTVGKARLSRSDAGANVTIESTGLVAGDAYTVWWIIINNGGPDGVSVMNATGGIADSEGSATFSAFLPVGFIHTEPASGNLRQLLGSGLQDVRKAEIQVVVRDHGPSTGDIEQISTLLGGCLVNEGEDDEFDQCADVQFAGFPAPHKSHKDDD